jgi:hypothetical protein
VISKITADDAARWKRFRAVAFGRAAEILKRTSHIKVELDLKKVALSSEKNENRKRKNFGVKRKT